MKKKNKCGEKSALDMIGKCYGALLVEQVFQSDKYGYNRWMVHCVCQNCGAEYDRLAHQVRQNNVQGCQKCYHREKKYAPRRDLSGQTINNLFVLEQVGEYVGADETKWLCECRLCGRKKIIKQRHIGVYKSCGCLSEKARETGKKIMAGNIVDGTNLTSINPDRAINKNSTTGTKGVSRTKNGTYRAYITLNRKQHNLGCFPTLKEAAQARKEAEEKLFHPILEAHGKIK